MKKTKNAPKKCENCSSELTTEEIAGGSGWCDGCNLPENDHYA